MREKFSFYEEGYDQILYQEAVHERFFRIGLPLKEEGKAQELLKEIKRQIDYYCEYKDKYRVPQGKEYGEYREYLESQPIFLDGYSARAVVMALQKALQEYGHSFGKSTLVFSLGKDQYPEEFERLDLITLTPPSSGTTSPNNPGNMLLSIFQHDLIGKDCLPYGEEAWGKLKSILYGPNEKRKAKMVSQRKAKMVNQRLAEKFRTYNKRITSFKLSDFEREEEGDGDSPTYKLKWSNNRKHFSQEELDVKSRTKKNIYSDIAFLNGFNFLTNIFEVARRLYRVKKDNSLITHNPIDKLAVGLYQSRVLRLIEEGEIDFSEVYNDHHFETYKPFLDPLLRENPTESDYKKMLQEKSNKPDRDSRDSGKILAKPRGIYGLVAGEKLTKNMELVLWKRDQINQRYNDTLQIESSNEVVNSFRIPGRNHNKIELSRLYGGKSESSDEDYSEEDDDYRENSNHDSTPSFFGEKFISPRIDSFRKAPRKKRKLDKAFSNDTGTENPAPLKKRRVEKEELEGTLVDFNT